MDTESTNDERNSSTTKGSTTIKHRTKERCRPQAMPTNTDINDPENLDYEDIDDNHSPGKLDDSHETEQINTPVKKLFNQMALSTDIQDDENPSTTNKSNEIKDNNVVNSSSTIDNKDVESDEGELNEADLEDGEIHDPTASRHRTSQSDESSSEQDRNQIDTNVPSSPQAKVHCRFFLQGRCHWGPNCKFIHPNSDSTKSAPGPSIESLPSARNEILSPTLIGMPMSSTAPTPHTWIPPQTTTNTAHFFPNPALRGVPPPPTLPLGPSTGTESAWERGLRSAKTLREQSMRRKQQDKDFNDKKFNLTIRDTVEEKDGDDNLLNVDRSNANDYDLNNLSGSHYVDQRTYPDRYHSYMYSSSSSNTHYNNNHRTNNTSRNPNALSGNDYMDRRARHLDDDYADSRAENRHRKDTTSNKNSKSSLKKDDSPTRYKRNSSQQQYASGPHHSNDGQLHVNQHGTRRGDDWHDPWDRLRGHGSVNRRSSGGGGRDISYSSSSSGTSSSSRSSRSRSRSTSSSSRSRSRSRSRPKRRSPSVTRVTKPAPITKPTETVKNGNEKKSNSNKRLVSSPSPTNKFLPGRQISSHTLKKAEKSSNSSNLMANNHAKDQHGKDSDPRMKKRTRKDHANRSDSTSSSSSSDSDTNRLKYRSSSSSSDSSSSENDSRMSTKNKTPLGSEKTASASSHSVKSINRQLSSSSGGGACKSTNTRSKNDSINRESSKTKESSTTSDKKRRDTSSSTGSSNTTKKMKPNDSQKSSADGNSAENCDANRKREQRVLKELESAEKKLIHQRSTKTSS